MMQVELDGHHYLEVHVISPLYTTDSRSGTEVRPNIELCFIVLSQELTQLSKCTLFTSTLANTKNLWSAKLVLSCCTQHDIHDSSAPGHR